MTTTQKPLASSLSIAEGPEARGFSVSTVRFYSGFSQPSGGSWTSYETPSVRTYCDNLRV